MPIYEYQCRQCQHRLEALQKFSDSVLTQCPACDQTALEKLVSAPSFRLKGSGWYETDFKTGKKKQLAGTTSADSNSKSSQSSNGANKAGKSADAGGASKPAKPKVTQVAK
ncbi:MAG: transcriptional regulator [SAR86 cluster bacterium]|uniref:Transcriptional regulator n=1 Tax=SAR86 cluster bacterium TaxID=2030880 RepID=A0A2A4MEC6_9GAMM|nr:MAG: transcriptional regulator [SAR86 cluster bacterium]